MVEAAFAQGIERTSAAGGALSASASIWFLAFVIGQWVFLYYIVAFYGGATLSGDFEGYKSGCGGAQPDTIICVLGLSSALSYPFILRAHHSPCNRLIN